MRQQKILNDCYYHVYNRGVDKRNIYLSAKDKDRFKEQLIRFNNTELAGHLCEEHSNGEKLVEVISYCLMPNHFHILLKQVEDSGISKYLHRLQTGYTLYFNKRHDRVGVLLQGAFKCKSISKNSYLLQLSKYIHTNPSKLFSDKYNDPKLINELLRKYRWSSLGEYLDKNHEPGVVDNFEPILGQFKDREDYEKFVFDI
jgi:putative transposase